MPVGQRWDILEGLLSHAEDANDHNLPLMYWYAAEPLADVDKSRALALAWQAKVQGTYSVLVRIDGRGNPTKVSIQPPEVRGASVLIEREEAVSDALEDLGIGARDERRQRFGRVGHAPDSTPTGR